MNTKIFYLVLVLILVSFGFYVFFDKSDSNFTNCNLHTYIDKERVEEHYSMRYDNNYKISWLWYETTQDLSSYKEVIEYIPGVKYEKLKNGDYKYKISVDYSKLDGNYSDFEFLQKDLYYNKIQDSMLKEFHCDDY